MVKQAHFCIETVISFIEDNLNGKLCLDTIAKATHYSKYHLHRMFTATVGMTMRIYVWRRQLTEAARFLVFSEKSIIEISFICGYESQQAFTAAFKLMYKVPPAKYRERGEFYPLQLPYTLHRKDNLLDFKETDISLAEIRDVPDWLELVRLVIDGYPNLDERKYLENLLESIGEKEALILKNERMTIGIVIFSYEAGSIEFMGIHPQYRSKGLQKLFLNRIKEDFLTNRQISITTFRANDRADTGYRKEIQQLGFSEGEILIEFGYPTQRFTLLSNE